MLNKIKDLYSEMIQTHISAADLQAQTLVAAAEKLVNCLLQGKKIIVCGHGRSYVNAQLLVANLLHRYDLERPSLPSVLLQLDSAVGSAIISEQHACFYQRQFNAVVNQGDLLVVFSPFGKEECILSLMKNALSKETHVIVFTGSDNTHIQGFLAENDLNIVAPSKQESRILEQHMFMVNAVCELIDQTLFSQR